MRVPARRILVGAAAFVGAAAVVLGGGRRGDDGGPETSAVPASTGVVRLVDQFSAGTSRSVVAGLERNVAARPHDAQGLALLGLGYQQLARETADAAWLTRSHEALWRSRLADPSDPVSLAGLAQLAVTRHHFTEAIPVARRALQLDPESSLARGALGDALLATGRYDEAFRAYDRLAGAGPSVGAYARVASARLLLGRREAALDAMELALEAGSGIPEQEAWALTRYGTVLVSARRLDGAASVFRRALVLAPGYVHAQAGLARVDIARGRYLAAANRLETVVARLPVPEYAILLGDSYARAGRRVDARRSYALVGALEQLLAANGVRTELQTAIFDLDRGVRKESALARARAAYRAAPGVAAADAVAWGMARTGRCLEARRWSGRALRLGTRDGLFFFHRGMIERCLSGDAAAAPWLKRALDADPVFSLRWQPLARKLAA